jgi:hypothetical protein
VRIQPLHRLEGSIIWGPYSIRSKPLIKRKKVLDSIFVSYVVGKAVDSVVGTHIVCT